MKKLEYSVKKIELNVATVKAIKNGATMFVLPVENEKELWNKRMDWCRSNYLPCAKAEIWDKSLIVGSYLQSRDEFYIQEDFFEHDDGSISAISEYYSPEEFCESCERLDSTLYAANSMSLKQASIIDTVYSVVVKHVQDITLEECEKICGYRDYRACYNLLNEGYEGGLDIASDNPKVFLYLIDGIERTNAKKDLDILLSPETVKLDLETLKEVLSKWRERRNIISSDPEIEYNLLSEAAEAIEELEVGEIEKFVVEVADIAILSMNWLALEGHDFNLETVEVTNIYDLKRHINLTKIKKDSVSYTFNYCVCLIEKYNYNALKLIREKINVINSRVQDPAQKIAWENGEPRAKWLKWEDQPEMTKYSPNYESCKRLI